MKALRRIVVLVALAIVVVLTAHHQVAPPPKPAIVLLPALTPVAKPAVTAAKPAAPPIQAAQVPVPKPAPSAPGLPALPQVQVAASAEHAVPPSPVSARQPIPLDLRSEEIPIPETSPSYKSLAPAYRPIPEGVPAKQKYFSGPARVLGATSLLVGKIPVELYGIERARRGTQCGPGIECTAAAEQMLQSRISGRAAISCHLARASLGVVVFATCVDSQGTDLGGVLVGEGLVFANPRQNYAYLGAEHVARDLKKGFWGNR